MIYLDDRVGAVELKPYLISQGLTVDVTRLEYGDLFWTGNGPTGTSTVGVERKRISDLAASVTSKRLSGHQLPGLLESYDYTYLVVEGRWRRSATGHVSVANDWGRWHDAPFRLPYAALEGYLATLQNIIGVRVHRSEDPESTSQWILEQYRWWTGKQWSEHHSHLAFARNNPTMLLVKAGLLRRVAKEFPRIGWEWSAAVEREFASVAEAVAAPESQWAEIRHNNRRLGKSAARAIVDAIHGRKHVTKE